MLTGIIRSLEGPGMRPVRPGNMHLTYKFLGDMEESQGAVVVDALRGAGLPPPFDVKVRGIGAFPDGKRPRVLWVGVDDPDGLAALIASKVNDEVAMLGWPREERAFRAHMTIARVADRRGAEAARQTLEIHRDHRFGTMSVARVQLVRSSLSPEGPRYETVGEATL